MSWIRIIPYEQASGKLKQLYERVKGPNNYIDNILLAHSLRPHTLYGHLALYKNVLHNSQNSLPKWYLESLGVYVSLLNGCDYCVQHHRAGLKRLLDSPARFEQIVGALQQADFSSAFGQRFQLGLQYAQKLTLSARQMEEADIAQLREAGFSDGEILEINQVVSYFNYANRCVLGLGITTDGELLGLSPGNSDEPDNWHHQ